jgi:hypothetical protein
MNFLYRRILKQALKTTWNLKFLWFFGIFAYFYFNGEEYTVISDNFKKIINLEGNIQSFHENIQWGFISQAWINFKTYVTGNIFTSLLTAMAVILVAAALIYLVVATQAAIINAAARFRHQEKTGLFEGFTVGTKYFWPVFCVNLLSKIMLYGLFLIFGVPLALLYLKFGTFAWLGFLSLMAFLILIPLNIVIIFLARYATIFIVLKNEKIKEAIKNSLRLFRRNWLVTLENTVILFLLTYAVNLIIIGSLAFAQLPFSQAGYYVYMAVVIFVGAFLTVFQTSAWTILFSYLDEGQGVPKLIRLFRGKPQEQK